MKRMALFLLASSAFYAQTPALEELIETARQGAAAPGLKDRISKTLSAKGGTAVWGQDFLFVADAPSPASISIDQQPAVPMIQIEGTTLWMLLRKMRTGVTH